jgi:hypothetical protein
LRLLAALALYDEIGSWLTGGSCLISGMILSNLFSFFGLLWAHRLVEIHFGRRLANRTLLLMIFYPVLSFFNFRIPNRFSSS